MLQPLPAEPPAQLEPAALQRRLRAAVTPSELLARVADEARALGFERAVVADLVDGRARTTTSARLRDPASDALRRRLRAEPVRLEPWSVEAALVRVAEGARRGPTPRGSVLADALGLEACAFSVLAPEGSPIGLLVADRPGPVTSDAERRAVDLLGHLGGLALERLLLRLRVLELAGEVRRFSASAQAVARDALHPPTGLPDERGEVAVFRAPEATRSRLDDLLTPREAEIAALLVQGRTNREVAEALVLAPATVKGYVERLLRKLGAANRAEAVARYLQLAAASAD